MGRSPCCEKAHTNKGAWTKEEDQRLIDYIRLHGEGCWRSLPKAAGLLRCGKSCRLRWINYLRPDLKRGNFTEEEDELIIKLHALLGNKWSLIAGRLPGRTDNEIKNYWNTHIKRKLISRGLDPQTHRPLNEITTSTPTVSAVATTATHLDFKTLSFKNNDTFHPKLTTIKKTESMDENNCTSSGTTTDEEQQQPPPPPQQHHTREKTHLNLELSIGLGQGPTQSELTRVCSSSSSNSAESRLQQQAVPYQIFAATEAVCLCWQLGSQRSELCRNCSTHNSNGLYTRYCSPLDS
ncbi:hypothetical protein ACOSQ2_009594 [Xanthoceras sorbifolium]